MTSFLPVRPGTPTGRPPRTPLRKIVWVGAVTMFAVAVAQSFQTVPHAQTAPTVWDGVYTEAQAARGKTVFAEQCAACHGDNLEGSGMAPGLSGSDFMSDFADSTVGEVFSRILKTMPATDPGNLKPEQVADILAFVAQGNKWPAGPKELPPDADALKLIKIVKK